MMIVRLSGLGRRQLHTIISRETIKPSSPTPSHLKTYNLLSLDRFFQHKYIPLILLYPNNSNFSLSANDKAEVMKKSLSQSLAKYYPFAGRLNTPTTPHYVDCNDQGVVFVEAKHDIQLKEFQHIITEQDEALDQFFADDLVVFKSPHSTSLVGVQLNHLACGGIAVGVSMSHIIGDGCTLGSFINYWAAVARYRSTDHKEVLPLSPHFFIYSPTTKSIPLKPQHSNTHQMNADCVTRKFVFPNKKLNDLKNKVIALGSSPPTRVEVLTSLLYKTAVSATMTESGFFTSSYMIIPADIRNKFVQKLPQTTVGNFLMGMIVQTRHTNETSVSKIVAQIQKEKSQLQGVQSLQHAAENIISFFSRLGNQDVGSISYMCSIVCGFPYYKADFGWGMPMHATIALKSGNQFAFLLQDSPDGDGSIEALVCLEKQVMEIFLNDQEFLSFCKIRSNQLM